MKVSVVLALLLASSISFCKADFGEPEILWKYKGPCYHSYCATGWYSSPAVTTIQGVKAVIGATYPVYAIRGDNATTIWSIEEGQTGTSNYTFPSSTRSWPDVAIADVNNDGTQDVITAHHNGIVGLWDINTGNPFPNWPYIVPQSSEMRSLAVADIDNDNQYEIIVGRAFNGDPDVPNTWVIEPNGTLRTGWPKWSNATDGYAQGVYNDNIGVGNIDSDPQLEILTPSDVTYVCAYDPDGTPLGINKVFFPASAQTTWGTVAFCTVPEYEVLPTACACGQAIEYSSTRTNFASGVTSIADLDNDGTPEIVLTGSTYSFCVDGEPSGDYIDVFNGVYVVKGDRTRWKTDTYNWNVSVPNWNNSKLGKPLTPIGDYANVQDPQPNSALGDLDGDGELEILFSSYDGKLHAFWLDKTEHCGWPFNPNAAKLKVGTNTNYVTYGSPPVIVDFDNDGLSEVVLNTWTSAGQTATGDFGSVYILNWDGSIKYRLAIPRPYSCEFDNTTESNCDYGGSLASPTVDNIDDTPEVEIVINTIGSGLVAWTVPGSSNARILYGTGRGSYQRTGEVFPVRTSFTPPTCNQTDSSSSDIDDGATTDLVADGDGGSSVAISLLSWLAMV